MLEKPFPRTSQPTKITKTIVEEVYESLRSEILEGKLPPESKLKIEDLKAKYNVSSSSIRESLSRLLSETLVTTEGQRGFRVAPISLKDFSNIAQMRTLLETQALKESIQTGDDNWEAGIVAAHHQLSKIEERLNSGSPQVISEWETKNTAFHNALIGACNNEWLLHFRTLLFRHSFRYIRLVIVDRTVSRDVHGEHQSIFNAVLNRDETLAVKLTQDHIERSVKAVGIKLKEVLDNL